MRLESPNLIGVAGGVRWDGKKERKYEEDGKKEDKRWDAWNGMGLEIPV